MLVVTSILQIYTNESNRKDRQALSQKVLDGRALPSARAVVPPPPGEPGGSA